MSSVKIGEKRNAKIEFNLLLVVAFLVFLVSAVIARLLPRRWRWNVSGHDEGKSVFASAWVAATNSIPFAFM